jgi:hypothetical protein
VKTEYNTARVGWRAMLIVAALLGACGPVEEGSGEEELGTAEQEALTGVALGIATGDIHTGVTQSLEFHSEQVIGEFSNLGARWIRINADVASTSPTVYRRIIEKAHSKGIQALVVVPAKYCGSDSNQAEIDAFTTAYVNHLNELALTVFTGTGNADAFEIGHQPNVSETTGCPDTAVRPRVSPNAFAWLLRRVWEWKQTNVRPELIVSGGLKNVYTSEPYWNALVASQAFILSSNPTVRIRPFDFFGVHPYNNANMDYQCINAGYTTCFTYWKASVKNGLQSAASRLNTATGTTNTRLWATEFGFQLATQLNCMPEDNCCTGIESCTLTHSRPYNATPPTPPYQQMAAAMNAAGEAFMASGVTPVAIWASYRDAMPKSFGLRGVFDAELNKYRVKTAAWNKYRSLTGSTGSINPEACWISGSYFPVNFENGDSLRTTSSDDWAYANYKSSCAPGERIMGLSKSIANGWSRSGICYKDPLDSGRYNHPVPETNPPPTTPDAPHCTVRDVQAGDDRGPARGLQPTTTLDWDAGNWRAECAPTEYVAGLAQSLDHQFTRILCCPQTLSAANRTCEAVVFGNGDNRQTSDSGNWDADGYKGECGVGRYVAGVSRTPAGQPNALLCCTQ